MTKYIEIVTNNHFGDALALTCALANARAAFPAVHFRYKGRYGELFEGLNLGEWPEGTEPDEKYFVWYRSHNQPEERGEAGNLADAFTLSLSRFMDVRIPEKHHAPVVRLTDEERDWAQLTLPPRAVLLNTNCQTCCTVKGYPWWGEVVRIVARNGYAPVLTGGTEERDLRLDFGSLPGETVDMRGKTTLRQLVAMATAAVCAASPSSSLVHACAAAGCPCVVITGAREPTKVTDYPGNRHVFSVCTVGNMLYNQHQGCFMRHFGEIAQWPQYVCPRTMERRGRKYAACMACIPPEAVAEEILKTTAQKEASK